MADNDENDTSPSSIEDATGRREKAGSADDTAAHASSAREAAPPSIDEGDPRTKDDGSGTSETD